MSTDHYLRAVTELGSDRKIVANCDIHSQNGIKLVAAGIRITRKMYDLLINHKLLPPLDNALSIDNMLSPEEILTDLLEVIKSSSRLEKAAELVNKTNSYQQIIINIRLPAPLAFKLTVAKEKYSLIYQHSLLLMAISIYLASCDGMNLQEKENVAIAALFQDIGLLHIDPKLLEPGYVMTDIERRHLYAHPLSAYMMLNEFSELPKQIANAVLEHHERMDGNGYPRGLSAKKISRLGQILGVALIAAKAFDTSKPRVSWRKLEVMLRLNSNQFGTGLIGHLNIFRDNAADTQVSDIESEQLIEQVNLIAKLFENFNALSNFQSNNPIYLYANSRFVELQLSLFRAGIDPRKPDCLIQMFMDDPDCMVEFKPIIEEIMWQLKSLMLDISRKWPEKINFSGEEASKIDQSWLNEMGLILSTDVMKDN